MDECVSVIIPNFNNAKWLSACLKSCLEQGELLHEIIVVDDHSSDTSWSMLLEWKSKYPKKIKLFKNRQKGANPARNFGFGQSSGKYIQWLDSDDRLLPGKFVAQVNALKRGNADIVYSDWQMDFWDSGQLVTSNTNRYENYTDFLEELIMDNWTSPNNYLMTRATAEKLDGGIGWNPETKVGQDREYFTMAGILGARFEYVPGVFAVYNKQSSGTISGMSFKERLESNQVLDERFRLAIGLQNWIDSVRKEKYVNILDTHMVKAFFYHPGLRLLRPINLFRICWHMMHWKMRLVMPWVWLRCHFFYYRDKLR